MQERAKTAEPTDVGLLAALAREAVDEQVGSRGGWVWSRREVRGEPFEQSFTQALGDPDQGLWVGEINAAAVGYCVVCLDTLRTGELLGIISDLYVTADAREVAVGERLIEAALAWCAQRGCVGVDALALPGNRATKNFFESFGFKARLLTVHRSLRTEASP